MQLNLLARLSPRAGQSRRDAPSTVPGAWRDSATSQLDAIAATNERVAAARLRRKAAALATVGGVALLVGASLWRPPSAGPSRPMVTAAVTEPARPAPVAVRAPSVSPPVVVQPATVPSRVAATPAAPSLAQAPGEDSADRARAAQGAEAQRKVAARQARERTRAEEALRNEDQLRRAKEEAEEARQRQLAEFARERAAAAEQVRQQGQLLAQAAPRDVRESCASSGGFLAEQFCQSRECRKAEHQGDALCLRLRDIELARAQHTADR